MNTTLQGDLVYGAMRPEVNCLACGTTMRTARLLDLLIA